MKSSIHRSVKKVHFPRVGMETIKTPTIHEVIISIPESIKQEPIELLAVCPSIIHKCHSCPTLI